MVDLLDPGGEQPVQLAQVSDPVPSACLVCGAVAAGGAGVGGLSSDFDEELLADGAEEPFDLTTALRAPRCGVDQPDPQLGTGPRRPGIDERRPVVDVVPTSA